MSRYMFVKTDDEDQTPLLMLDVTTAVGADYLSFIGGIIEALLSETTHLEAEANALERTIDTNHFPAFGSIPSNPQSSV